MSQDENYRHVWTVVPSGKAKEVSAMLKAIHAQEDLQAARDKAADVVAKLKRMNYGLLLNGLKRVLRRHCTT